MASLYKPHTKKERKRKRKKKLGYLQFKRVVFPASFFLVSINTFLYQLDAEVIC